MAHHEHLTKCRIRRVGGVRQLEDPATQENHCKTKLHRHVH